MTARGTVCAIADDLTGANATAAGFAQAGMRAVTIGAGRPAELAAELSARFDAVVVCTDARHCPPEEAAGRVTAVIHAVWPVALVCNRVDSTLRGNVGATTAAALGAVGRESGRRAVALCAPAHPAAGRCTVEGRQLLGGVRLEDTELAADPRSPVPTSDVATLLRRQADLRVAHVPLSAVTGRPDELGGLVRRLLADGADAIVADALTVEHLDRVAVAAVSAVTGRPDGPEAPDGPGEPAEIIWVGVDPGPASVALARALGLTGHAEGAPLLAVSGSTTSLTRVQLARLREGAGVTVVRPPVAGPGIVPDVDLTAAVLDGALAAAGPGEVVLLATAIEAADVGDPDPADAARLPVALARAVGRALGQRAIDGLFATGGDVSAALLAELSADGVEVEEEVVPLAVAGTMVGGPWAGLPVVTKGGLVGDEGTVVRCVEHLRRMAGQTRRHVPAARPRSAAADTAAAAAAATADVADADPVSVPGSPPDLHISGPAHMTSRPSAADPDRRTSRTGSRTPDKERP